MPFYSRGEMKRALDEYEPFREYLYCRGFLITTYEKIRLSGYPFYNNWRKEDIDNTYSFYLHKDCNLYTYTLEGTTFFLIGHAYDPYNNIISEVDVLQNLAKYMDKSSSAFWEEEGNLTGVFCIGFIKKGELTYAVDCCGMQIAYKAIINGDLFLSSHSKLIADLFGIKQDPYIVRLVNRRLFKYWGRWLPGDLSPFKEITRSQPNFYYTYDGNNRINYFRFYPNKKVDTIHTKKEYQKTIHLLGEVITKSLDIISKKWPDKKVAMSVTGGRDSMTTFSCANGIYDCFSYFSYISNYPEQVDAEAAGEICKAVGVSHEIIHIPEESCDYDHLELFRKILLCNNGCISMNNKNDAKKRLYFCLHPSFDIEIKSWINEMGRGWYYNKYQKKKFPKLPTAKYWRAMHKVYLGPRIIYDTTKVFQEYLNKYYSENVFSKMSWLDLYFWEFSWSGLEGLALTSEHRVSYEITIPYNNRRYIETMLTLPLRKRIVDDMPRDIIHECNPKVEQTGISVKDIEHTDNRSRLVRAYLEIFSRI